MTRVILSKRILVDSGDFSPDDHVGFGRMIRIDFSCSVSEFLRMKACAAVVSVLLLALLGCGDDSTATSTDDSAGSSAGAAAGATMGDAAGAAAGGAGTGTLASVLPPGCDPGLIIGQNCAVPGTCHMNGFAPAFVGNTAADGATLQAGPVAGCSNDFTSEVAYFLSKISQMQPCPSGAPSSAPMMPPPAGTFQAQFANTPVGPLSQDQIACLTAWGTMLLDQQ